MSHVERSKDEGQVERSAAGAGAAKVAPMATFDAATSGSGSAVPYRGDMERSFGHDFCGVSAHLGRSSEMESINAHAATDGAKVAFASSSPSRETVAHELGNPAQVDVRLAAAHGLSAKNLLDVKADPAVTVLKQHFASQNPWYNAPGGGTALADGRVYQQSYNRAGGWCSYASAARAHKVSQYQFRAPGEWIAEVYATYYDPGTASSGNKGDHVGDDVPGTAPGALLNGRDAAAKTWFDNNVHNR